MPSSTESMLARTTTAARTAASWTGSKRNLHEASVTGRRGHQRRWRGYRASLIARTRSYRPVLNAAVVRTYRGSAAVARRGYQQRTRSTRVGPSRFRLAPVWLIPQSFTSSPRRIRARPLTRVSNLKRLPYRQVELLAGYHHIHQRLRFGAKSVPGILFADGEKVLGSRAILHRLDERVPEPRLLPSDPKRRQAVESAERWGEQVLQDAVRRIEIVALNAEPAIAPVPSRGIKAADAEALGSPHWPSWPTRRGTGSRSQRGERPGRPGRAARLPGRDRPSARRRGDRR